MSSQPNRPTRKRNWTYPFAYPISSIKTPKGGLQAVIPTCTKGGWHSSLHDVIDQLGKLLRWEQRKQVNPPERLCCGYNKLIANLDPGLATIKRATKKEAVFVIVGAVKEGGI